MHFTIRHFAAVLVGAAAVTVSVSGTAGALASTDPGQIKPILAGEIAHRLGASVQPVQRQATFPLGAQSRGPLTLLHSADMRWSQAGQAVGEPWPRPEPQPRPWPVPSPRPKPWPWPWPDPEKPWPGPGPVPEPIDAQMGAARPWV